jgi:uncharacterized protein DUF6647
MKELLTAIVLWLSTNCGLPPTYEHPRVEFVPATEMVALMSKGRTADRLLQPGVVVGQSDQAAEIVSVYDDSTKTIYLPVGWTSSRPADLSVLVHEMVHHLQNVAGLKFECPQEREQLAYSAQERWLGLFGHDLLHDFELDGFTILVKTKCFY